ncbi:hypothetical protein HW130_32220 [Streptomyces sp. PKU-EA00015]|uniref:hypothetical protein n=1 Tax=Streptomyces sp. PKU-EA00015 TaxID=2748326 RepID=UPI0015A3B7DC|nr:hypothetical protein [Streptomyces sp. PKU-EA00015]NWF30860.1 hypothetical protein [Streptomyces sp. PKU-EA00015]
MWAETAAWVEWLARWVAIFIGLGAVGRVLYLRTIGRRVDAGEIGFALAGAVLLMAAPSVAGWLFDTAEESGSEPDDAPPATDGPADMPWETITLVAALVIAVAGAVAAVAAVTRTTKKRRRNRRTEADRRAAIEARHDAVREAYGAFSADIFAVLERPRLADVAVPQTAALVTALATAGDARAAAGPKATADYAQAVTALEIAWRVADEHARKAGTSQLPARERAAVEQAAKLLRTALNDGGTDHERRLSYQRAMTLITNAIVIPRQALAAVEHRAHPVLDSKEGPRA